MAEAFSSASLLPNQSCVRKCGFDPRVGWNTFSEASQTSGSPQACSAFCLPLHRRLPDVNSIPKARKTCECWPSIWRGELYIPTDISLFVNAGMDICVLHIYVQMYHLYLRHLMTKMNVLTVLDTVSPSTSLWVLLLDVVDLSDTALMMAWTEFPTTVLSFSLWSLWGSCRRG